MSQHKRQQQLQHDFANLLQTPPRAVQVHQQADQQWRNEDPQQA